jgi:hypothetical protein
MLWRGSQDSERPNTYQDVQNTVPRLNKLCTSKLHPAASLEAKACERIMMDGSLSIDVV